MPKLQFQKAYPLFMQHLGVGIIPWSPIARGVLTRPWGTSTKRAETDARVNGFYSSSTCARDTVGRVEEIANKKGVKMAQISIAWSLKKVTAPIVGTTKLENLKEMIGKSSDLVSLHSWLLIPDPGIYTYRRDQYRVNR